jgi:hypothetical protein
MKSKEMRGTMTSYRPDPQESLVSGFDLRENRVLDDLKVSTNEKRVVLWAQRLEKLSFFTVLLETNEFVQHILDFLEPLHIDFIGFDLFVCQSVNNLMLLK